MTVKGGTTPACAACKYQRRKCSPICPLAPYFPATQPKTFQNVHRLFGVSNVTKTLERLQTKDEKEDAMKSIIFEADMRQRFPAHGCCAIIAHLRLQLQQAVDELRLVYVQLQACRDQVGAQNNGNSSNDLFLLDEVKPLLNYDNDLSVIQAHGFSLHYPGDFGLICHNNFVSSSDSSQLENRILQENRAGPGRRREPSGDFGLIYHDNFVSSSDSSQLENRNRMLQENRAGPGRRRELQTAAACFSLTTSK